jgi:ribosomal protein S18 acetylase RimI-like enzyme
MAGALNRSWSLARPFVNMTPGDLEWWRVQAHPFDAWSERIRLWELGGDVVGYAWLSPTAELDWHQRADLPWTVRRAIVADAIEWTESTVRSSTEQAGAELPRELKAWAVDADVELVRTLETDGWRPAEGERLTHWYRRLVGGDALPHRTLPPGYRLRSVRWPDDIEARVEVHRAAFAPSRMTTEKYVRLLEMPRYAAERDVVVEAPDGSLAAFALAWWDPQSGIGELEPVGTHPAHRRLGLARAVDLEALARLRDAGAIDALVFSKSTNEAAEALYASVGFRAITWSRAWTRPLA